MAIKFLDNYKRHWDELVFDLSLTTPKRIEEWKKEASNLLLLLKGENVGLIADTSAGKTMIALMVALATDKRVLFLSPQVYLCNQHDLTFKSITRESLASRVITGETRKAKRLWREEDKKIIFATPQTVLRELVKGDLHLADFGFMVIDEYHLAQGKYAYVELARLADELDMRILGLTASPGGTLEKVEACCSNCRITWIQGSVIETPYKSIERYDVAVDELFKRVDIAFRDILQMLKEQIYQYLDNQPPKGLLSNKRLESIAVQFARMEKGRMCYAAFKFYSMYRKLMHAYRSLVIDGNQTFLDYCADLKAENSYVSRAIFSLPKFRRIIDHVEKHSYEHPKLSKLKFIASRWAASGKNGLIFVYQRRTAHHLVHSLRELGLRAEYLSSKDSTSTAVQKAVLDRLAEKEIDFVVCTTILQVGVSVPEIDAVFHFDLPSSIVAKIQKDGRTARLRPGKVFYLVLDHELDLARYHSVLFQMKRMHDAIDIFNARSRKSSNKIEKRNFIEIPLEENRKLPASKRKKGKARPKRLF